MSHLLLTVSSNHVICRQRFLAAAHFLPPQIASQSVSLCPCTSCFIKAQVSQLCRTDAGGLDMNRLWGCASQDLEPALYHVLQLLHR